MSPQEVKETREGQLAEWRADVAAGDNLGYPEVCAAFLIPGDVIIGAQGGEVKVLEVIFNLSLVRVIVDTEFGRPMFHERELVFIKVDS